MGGEVNKALFAFGAGGQEMALIDMPVIPGIRIFAIEQNDGAGGRFLAERRAFAFDLFHGVRAAIGGLDGDLAVAQFRAVAVLARENNFIAVAFAGVFGFVLLVPALAGQPAGIGDHAEFVVAQRDHLRAAPIIFIFALVLVIAPRLGGIEEGFSRGFLRRVRAKSGGQREDRK